MRKIKLLIVAAFHSIIKLLKGFIFSSEAQTFDHESYKILLPLISSINSYLQTFLGVLASSLMALDSAFIVVILSGDSIKSVALFSLGLSILIASIVLYILSFFALLRLRLTVLSVSKTSYVNFENISYKLECAISQYISQMIFISCSFFLSFIFLLLNAIK